MKVCLETIDRKKSAAKRGKRDSINKNVELGSLPKS
jgi:hypothetical protein